MKSFSLEPRALGIRTLWIVASYAILFQIISRTKMIEKIMTVTFEWWELLVVILFIASRAAVYLLLPAIWCAVGVSWWIGWLGKTKA